MGYKGRDVEVVFLDDRQCIVIACDSCGAIGSKDLDIVKVSPYIVGRLTARVALMEVISVGAVPKTLAVTISNEPYPTGEEIINGVNDEVKSMSLGVLPIAVSTEKNMETRQTAIGVTVIGLCERENLRISMSKPGSLLYCLGIPKVGNEIKDVDDVDIVQGNYVRELLKIKGIHDIVPVGSGGILKEIEALCSNVNCKFIFEPEREIDVIKSAGPSTCLIFTCSPNIELSQAKLAPLIKLGRLEEL
jgi:hypothetical protein